MDAKITTLHRAILWLAFTVGAVIGLGYFLAPGPATSMMRVEAPDHFAIRTIGCFLLGQAVGAWFALKSNLWKEVKIFTMLLITANSLNSLSVFVMIFFGRMPFSMFPNAIITGVLGFGLLVVYLQYQSKTVHKLGA